MHKLTDTRTLRNKGNWLEYAAWSFLTFLPAARSLEHSCILIMLDPVEVDSGASCWSGQFIRATIYCLTTLPLQLPKGCVVKTRDCPRIARNRRANICRHLNSCNPPIQTHTHITYCAPLQAPAVDLFCSSLAVRAPPREVILQNKLSDHKMRSI